MRYALRSALFGPATAVATLMPIWEKEYEKYKANNDDHIRLVKQIH